MTAGTSVRRAAFLDRDGVINLDHGYVFEWEKFEFVPGAIDGMRRLHEAGFSLVVVTNQSGIARGMYTEEAFEALTTAMREHLASQGAPIAAVYHCPHHPQARRKELAIECACRKPQPGMILRALEDLGLDPGGSFLVGDKYSDIQAARLAGLGKAFLVASEDYQDDPPPPGIQADASGRDLADVVDQLLSTSRVSSSR